LPRAIHFILTMVTQEEMKAELKQLMQIPENLVCVDCSDKRPMWASLIVPPPDSSLKDPIGCFCCYQCSGAHRRMGTHICFVRSTNLDEWKEKELMAMKEGGNELINGLFEAKLKDKQKSVVRPDNHTNLEDRSNFIYDKYQHRKWYSAEVYKKLKLREKADAAMNRHKNVASDSAMEEDFFASRAANKGRGGGKHIATNNEENEWWKNGSSGQHKEDLTASTPNNTKNNLNFLGDRRKMLSATQVESKSRLMADLTLLAIDNEKGSSPSQIKLKTSRTNRRDARRRNLSPAIQEEDIKSVTSSGRAAPSVRKAPGRTKSSSSSVGDDNSRGEKSAPPSRKAPGRSKSSSSSTGDDSSRGGKAAPPGRTAPGRSKSSISSVCDDNSRADSKKSLGTSSSSGRLTRHKPPLRSASGPVTGMARAVSQHDSSVSITSSSSRKPRSIRDMNGDPRVGRTKSFDDGDSKPGRRSRSSSAKRSRGAARKNRALVESMHMSVGSESAFSQGDSVFSQDSNDNDDDESSRRSGGRRRRGGNPSGGLASVLGDNENKSRADRTGRGDDQSVRSRRSAARSSSRDDVSRASSNRRPVSSRDFRSTRRRGDSADSSSPPRSSKQRESSDDSVTRTPRSRRRNGSADSTSPKPSPSGAPISVRRVVKDRKPRIPNRANGSPKSAPIRSKSFEVQF